MENLDKLAAMSNKYGADSAFVLAGGGNTSFKTKDKLYVKGSGTSLASIKPEDFVVMERAALDSMWDKTYPSNEKQRESEVLSDMMAARAPGENRRPSVETLLHNLFPQKYVLHVHPTLVNGLTCSKSGKKLASELFPDSVWVDECKPGYILAAECKKAMEGAKNKVSLLFLGNHGVFFAGNSPEEIDKLCDRVMLTLSAQIKEQPDFTEAETDIARAAELAPVIRTLWGEKAIVTFMHEKAVMDFKPETESASPDHIVYAKAKYLILDKDADIDTVKSGLAAFESENGYKARIVYVKGVGAFACGEDLKAAYTAAEVFRDLVKVTVYAKSFGGYKPLKAELRRFIISWEAESYRAKVNAASSAPGRLCGKVVIVTGAAQGFGQGIAEQLAAEGAYVVVADMNGEGAKATAASLPGATAVTVNVTDEASVRAMVEQTVLTYGGIDVFVNNAGIVRAGSLEEMTKSNFELVTSVNYTAYFLCVKYAVVPMKLQHKADPARMFDIIEINSKSGLAGSNKNFAYAGSKFGGIGLTQSFAMELAEYNIKVNAICPGNFLDGPLWSDPVKGLFVQYLAAGKVKGAKTVADVRAAYEAKVPLGRGCRIMDVVRAIFYIIEQQYETGQAIPVTGGQEMLK